VNIQYTPLQDSIEEMSSTYSKNISTGGICIFGLEKFNVGALLNLKFSLPQQEDIISAIGKIVWVEQFSVGEGASSRAYEAGVEFTHIDENDKQKIDQYILGGINKFEEPA
jgi:Tfp pilus assembly protein PilZ